MNGKQGERLGPDRPKEVEPLAPPRAERLKAWADNLEHGPGFATPPEIIQTLEGVTPESPERERREAVEKVLEYDAGLRGDWAPLVREDLFRLTSERTGYSFEALWGMAEDHATRRRREEREGDLEAAVLEAWGGVKEGAAITGVAKKLERAVDTYRLRGEDEETPLAFSVDRLDLESLEAPGGLSSGWDALDSLGIRFNPGELALLGARTGHGKTSFLVGLLRNWLEKEEPGLLVLYSAEEPEVRIYHRLLALLTVRDAAGFTSNEARDFLRDPNSRETWGGKREDLDKARECLRSWEKRLLVVHRPAWDVEKLVAHARTVAEARKVGGVLVDYLQRIPAPARSYDRRDIEVSAVARYLKSLAVDLHAPVVAGAQINREAVRGKDVPAGDFKDSKVQNAIRSRRPQLHHLREGGSEQEADLILGLLNYRADYEADEDGEKRAGAGVPETTPFEVGTLKNRYGDVGRWASLAFEGRFHFIRDRESYEEDL